MKVAIILAVSDYRNATCLSGCILDAQLMESLLNATNQYSDVLLINQDTDSLKVKEKLSSFISNNQGKIFDEVFFYYTGHGDFHNNEFYYLLSDFDESYYRQTSLANSELDNLLRQLSPKLTIKVIDACHSGVTYIKDNNAFYKHLEDSKNRFSNCYFMFSSMNDQLSWQTKIVSDFTRSFIDSILNYKSSADIRYKHIVDYISDEFERNSRQKPFFITQAAFTEVFCSVSEKLRNLVSDKLNVSLEGKSEAIEVRPPSLLELVKMDAERYCSREEVLKYLNEVKHFTEEHPYSFELSELYKISARFEDDYTSISNCASSIGKWLKDNENSYFAKRVYGRELIVDTNTPSLLRGMQEAMASIYGNYRTVITGFELTVDAPFKLIKIEANPKYPNIDLHDCKIAFVFSQISIRFFYYYSSFKLKTWDSYSHDLSSDWQTIEVAMKDSNEIKETLSNILDKFAAFVLEPLKAKYILNIDGRVGNAD